MSRTATRTVGPILLGLLAVSAVSAGQDPLPIASPPPPRRHMGVTSSEWAAQLRHASVAVRREAIESLISLLPDSKSEVPRVIVALDDQDPVVRRQAAWFLSLIGPEAKASVTKLAHLLADENEDVRRQAIESLHQIGWTPDAAAGILQAIEAGTDVWVAGKLADMRPLPADAQTRLVACLASPDPRVRLCALRGLRAAGAGGPELANAVLPFVEDRDATTRAEAVHLLGQLGGDAAAALPTLRLIPHRLDPALDGPADLRDPETSRLVAWARIAPRDEELLPTLLEAIATDDGPHRYTAYLATVALGYLAREDERAQTELVKLLRHREERIAGAAARICSSLGEAIVPQLDEAWSPSPSDERSRMADAHIAAALTLIPTALESQERLARVLRALSAAPTAGPLEKLLNGLRDHEPSARLIAALIAALDNEDPDVRRIAANCLQTVRPPPAAAVPKLIQLLNDPLLDVRAAAAYAIATIQPESGSVALAELLESLDREGGGRSVLGERIPAGQLPSFDHLSKVVTADEEVAAALGEMLRSQDPEQRRMIAAVVGEIDRPAATIVLGMLRDRRQEVRLQALALLGKAGPEAKPAVPDLIDYLQSDDRRTRQLAEAALAAIGPDAAAAVPALVTAARRDSFGSSAEFALSRIGKPAVPALMKLLAGRDFDDQRLAVRVLGAIGPGAAEALPALSELGINQSATGAGELLRGNIARAVLSIATPRANGQPGVAEIELEMRSRPGIDRQPIPARPPASAVPLLVELLPEPAAAAVLVAHPDLVTPHLPRILQLLKEAKPGLREPLLQVVASQRKQAAGATDLLRQIMRQGASDSGEASIALARVADQQAIDDLLGLLKRPAELPDPDGLVLPRADSREATAANRASALRALGYIENGVDRVVPALVGGLRDRDAGVQRAAAEALRQLPLYKIEKAASEVLVELPPLPPNQEPLELRSLRERLNPQPPRDVEDLGRRRFWPPPGGPNETVAANLRAMEHLRAADGAELAAAVKQLQQAVRLPPARQAVPLLLRALTEEAPRNYSLSLADDPRIVAAELLGRYGDDAREALPALIAMTRGKRDWPHVLAPHVAAIGPTAVPTLTASLKDSDRSVRKLAALTLADLGAAAKPAEPEIVQAFWSADNEQLDSYCLAIAAVGPSQETVDALLAQARGTDSPRRGRAWMALALLAPVEPRVQDAMYELLASGNPQTVVAVGSVLFRREIERRPQITPQTAERIGRLLATNPRVPPELDPGDVSIAAIAAAGLASLGPDAAPAMPHLLEALKSNEHKVQLAAVHVLGSIGPPAAAALPQLAELLSHAKTPSPRAIASNSRLARRNGSTGAAAVVHAIVQIGGSESAAALAPAVDDFDPAVRRLVYTQFVRGKQQSKPALNPLIAALASPRPEIRSEAARAIGALGPAAESAVPQLAAILEDDRIYVRKSAAIALGQIGPGARSARPALERLQGGRLTCLKAAAEAALTRINE